MRILYFYQYFGTPKGGWSTRVYELTRRWVAEGHEVTVITSPYDKSDIETTGKLIHRLQIDGIQVIVINLKQSNQHSLLYRSFTFLGYSVLSVFYGLRWPYDIAIASSGPITVGLPALMARFLRGKPFIFEVRDLWPEGAIQLGLLRKKWLQKIAYWFEYQCYKYAKYIITCSKGMSDNITARFGFRNVAEIPNASDNEVFGKVSPDFQLPDWAVGKKLFLYTGSLGLMDDVIQLLEAARVLMQMGRKDIAIVIAGEGRDRPFLESYAHEHVLRNIFLLGLLPKTEIANWLAFAYGTLLVFKDVEVLDTSSPNKLFDYMASGKPVIQTTQGWISDLMKEKCYGITVPPNDPEAMAAAIIKLVDHPSIANEMGTTAKWLATEVFDRDLLAGKYLEILKEVSSY